MTTDTSFLSLLTSVTLKNGDWALERAPYSQDRDDDVTVFELRKSFREHGWHQGVKDRPHSMRNTSKGPSYYFLLSNAHSASALKAEWEEISWDQKIVASVQMRLRNCIRWNPKTPKDVQVWAKSLGNMFRGGRQCGSRSESTWRKGAPPWQVGKSTSRKKVSQKRLAGRRSSHTTIVVSTMCSSSSLVWSNAGLHSIACAG